MTEAAIRAQALEEAACVAEQGLGGYLCPYGRDKPGDPTWNHTDADICPVCRENSEGSLLKCHDQIAARIAARIRALITDPAAIAAWNRRAGGEREQQLEAENERLRAALAGIGVQQNIQLVWRLARAALAGQAEGERNGG